MAGGAPRVDGETALARLAEAGLYVLFDPRTRPGWQTELEALAQVGVPWFQLRAKGAEPIDLEHWLAAAREAVGEATLILNDAPELAKAAGADGVHLGPDDPAPPWAREVLGPDAIIGSSGDDERRLTGPAAVGVTYFGIGTYRTSSSKPDAGRPLGPERLREAVAMADAPAVAIGGIVPGDMPELWRARVRGAAVLSGVWAAGDPVAAARRYLKEWRRARTPGPELEPE